MPSGNVLGDGGFWTLDTVPPVALDRAAIGVSEYPTSVRLQWQPAADDPGGVGIYGYYVYRNGVLVTLTTGTQWIDSAASPSTT